MKRNILFLLWIFCFSQFANGQYLVPTLDKTTNKYGYKEKDKIEWSLPPIYKSAHYFCGNLAIVDDGEYKFMIDLHGNKVSPNFKNIQSSSGNEPYVCQGLDGNYNMYDAKFQPICKTSYQYMSYFSGFNVLSFQSEGLYGLMDLEGNVLIPPVYKKLSLEDCYYPCGWKRCKKDGIDHKLFSDAFVLAQNKEGKYGIVTLNNEVIVPFTYNDLYKVAWKGAKKAYKETIKPYLLSAKKEGVGLTNKRSPNAKCCQEQGTCHDLPYGLACCRKDHC